jgi:ribosomal protein S18 acetylase RimI-like enzyme
LQHRDDFEKMASERLASPRAIGSPFSKDRAAMPSVEVRRLEVADVEDYRRIRLAALRTEPQAFGSTYEVEAVRPVAAFAERLTTSTVFGAYDGGRIVGVAGFKQEDGQKDRHKAFVCGMYVEPDVRGQAVGTALIEAVIGSAREVVEQLTLAVVQGNSAAISLYRKFGFEVYGIEPRALKSSSGYSDEVLMALMLRPAEPIARPRDRT